MEQNVAQPKRKIDYDKYGFLILESILLLISVAGAVCVGRLMQKEWLWIGKAALLVSLVVVLFAQVLRFISERDCGNFNVEQNNKSNLYGYNLLFVMVHLCSVSMITLSTVSNMYGFWMLGAWVLGIVINPYIGAAYQSVLCLGFCILAGKSIEEFAFLFLVGVGSCILTPYLRKLSTIGYVVLIVLLCNGMLLILQSDFRWAQLFSWNSFAWEASIFVSLLLATFLAWIYKERLQTGSFSFVKTGIKEFFSEEESTYLEKSEFVKICDLEKKVEGNYVSMEKILRKDYPLWKEMEKRLPEKALHMKKVAELAKKAALKIQADEMLAYAGGLYHEIGRLNGAEYVSQGVLIALEQGFLPELVSIIEEHNVKNKLPVSKEATIVMLADGVASMIEKAGAKKIANNDGEFVKKFFQIRMENGEVNESEITFHEYMLLCEFFCEEVKNM